MPLTFSAGGGDSYWRIKGVSQTLLKNQNIEMFPCSQKILLTNEDTGQEIWTIPADIYRHNLTYDKGGASNQLFCFNFTVRNSSSTLNNHRMSLFIRTDKMSLLDNTSGQWVW